MKILPTLVLAVILSACVSKSELDEANKINTALKTQNEALVADLESIKAELESLKTASRNLQDQNIELKSQVDEKPSLPIKVSIRKAMMGPGNVLVLSTTVKSTVPVLITVHSAALGTTKSYELHLDPSRATELGHMEGAVIEYGDNITIENQNYTPVNFTLSNRNQG